MVHNLPPVEINAALKIKWTLYETKNFYSKNYQISIV